MPEFWFPADKKLSSSEVRSQWRDILDYMMIGGGEITVMRYGSPVAVIVPYYEWKVLREEENEKREP